MKTTAITTIDEVFAELREDCDNDIQSAKDRLKTRLKKVRQNAKDLAKLSMILPAEFEVKLSGWYNYTEPVIKVPQDNVQINLQKLRAAVGTLNVDHKDLADASKSLIRVYLVAEKYPGIQFTYETVLSDDSPCKIKEVTSPASTYKTLVCDNKNAA